VAEADVLPFEGAESDSLVRAGDKLRAAREAMGLDRAALSHRIKINARHLAALEAGDFAALPAPIYAVGFSRSYAGAVGLDGPEIASQVRRELEAQERPAPARPAYDLDLEDPAKSPTRRLAWVAAALGLALLVAGAMFWRSYFVPAVDLPPVSEQALATATVNPPELSPGAAVSPTAESAAGLAAPASFAPEGAPQATVAPAARPPVPASTAAPGTAPSSGVQSLPSPQPERLRPAPSSEPVPTASAT
jgi:cytoskeletal protein RodZ